MQGTLISDRGNIVSIQLVKGCETGSGICLRRVSSWSSESLTSLVHHRALSHLQLLDTLACNEVLDLGQLSFESSKLIGRHSACSGFERALFTLQSAFWRILKKFLVFSLGLRDANLASRNLVSELLNARVFELVSRRLL